jgi:hypothetical protein
MVSVIVSRFLCMMSGMAGQGMRCVGCPFWDLFLALASKQGESCHPEGRHGGCAWVGICSSPASFWVESHWRVWQSPMSGQDDEFSRYNQRHRQLWWLAYRNSRDRYGLIPSTHTLIRNSSAPKCSLGVSLTASTLLLSPFSLESYQVALSACLSR